MKKLAFFVSLFLFGSFVFANELINSVCSFTVGEESNKLNVEIQWDSYNRRYVFTIKGAASLLKGKIIRPARISFFIITAAGDFTFPVSNARIWEDDLLLLMPTSSHLYSLMQLSGPRTIGIVEKENGWFCIIDS